MLRIHPLERPFRRYVRSFQHHVEPALAGKVEPLHQVRVATRRLRELAPLLAAELGDTGTKKIMVRLRDLGQALGPVRELDVSLDLLGKLSRDGATPEDAAVRLWQHLSDLREGYRARLLHSVDPHRAVKLGRRMMALNDDLRTHNTGAWRRALSLRMSRRAKRLHELVEAAGALYVPDRVHAVRIACKKLRYSFELAAEAGATRKRVPARQLKAVQDTLGRLHDIEVLTQFMQEQPLPLPPAPPWVIHLDEFRYRLETESRGLHSDFIVARRQIVRAGDSAIDMAERLWVRRPATDSLPAPLKMGLSGDPSAGASRRLASGRAY